MYSSLEVLQQKKTELNVGMRNFSTCSILLVTINDCQYSFILLIVLIDLVVVRAGFTSGSSPTNRYDCSLCVCI